MIELKSPPSLYNQSLQGDEEFVANFVARRQVLETLCRRLEINGSESDSQHHILIGSRGMGKTSLLRRLAIEIDRSPKLSARFIPLMFREEQYNVLHLRDFWQNCGEALAEWAEAHGDDQLAARLDDAICSETWADDEGAADQFFAAMNALGKRAVLMVDNLDLIIDALKDSDRWTLRGSLQMRGGPIVIGAATQSLRESADRKAAFYEFFQQSYLEPLSLPETETCMRALASGRGELGRRVVTILNSDRARLKVLHRLTGGNPRVLALTYRFLETTDTNDAMGDLERLLDEVTPYYKARVEEYQTPLQRATIDAIALHWDPVTTGELSKIMGVPSTTLSPQLSRLRKDGLIESTETSGSYAGHQISERFLNIWYLMRHGTRRNKQRMRWLVAFLSSFYSSNDLDAIDREARASGLAARWTTDYAEAFEQAKQRAGLGLKEKVHPVMRRSDRIEQDAESSTTQFEQGIAMLYKGITRGQSGDAAAAIKACDAFVARFADRDEPELKKVVAIAMVYRGLSLSQIGDAAAAINTCDAVIERFGDSSEPEITEKVATAMFHKGITLGQTGDAVGEIETYDAVVARFGDNADPKIREKVASAMVYKGVTLGQRGDAAGEIETYEEVVARFGGSADPEIRKQVATAMLYKGVTLGQTGDAAGEIETYDAVVARFGDSADPETKEQVATAMLFKGGTLGQNGDAAGEVEAYDALITRFGDCAEPELKRQVAIAMLYKGITLGQSGEDAAAIETYDEVVARFGNSTDQEIKNQVALAMVNTGVTLGRSGNAAAAINRYNAVIARFGDGAEPEVTEPVAKAMLYKGVTLGQSGDAAAEIEVYDAIVARFGDSDRRELKEQVAKAMVNKSVTLGQSGDAAAAIEACDAVIERFGDSAEQELKEPVAKAMFYKGVTLGQSGEPAAAVEIFDAVVARFGDSARPELNELVAMAMVNKGDTVGRSGDAAAEILYYEQALALMRGINTESAAREKANIAIRVGNLLFDGGLDQKRSEALFLQASEHSPLSAYANLFWLYISSDRVEEAKQTIGKLDGLPPSGRLLIEAALAFDAENFGEATGYLQEALSGDVAANDFDFTDDIERLVRIAIAKGFGERLIDWFEKTRFAERYAPIHVAMLAAVRGERMLLDSNPEVRDAASEIYARLVGSKGPRKGKKP